MSSSYPFQRYRNRKNVVRPPSAPTIGPALTDQTVQTNRSSRLVAAVSDEVDVSACPDDFAQQAAQLIPAQVRMISGCHSEQTSADCASVPMGSLPHPAGRAGGACTSTLLEILYARRHETKSFTFQKLLLELRQSLRQAGFEQIPQLTASRPLDVQDTPFTLVGGQGQRRAVLVGINYRGQDGELRGCHNDVWNMKRYLEQVQGYPDENILVLMDDGVQNYPSRANIILALKQLVTQSQAGDSVYFHYSGHGGLLSPDWNAFKSSQKEYDETLYPVDHERSGQIRDFSLFNHFVKPMPAGVTVTCVMDCCHSGGVLDLPYSYQPTSVGTIRMQRSLDNLSNLALLYVMAGGWLPHGFENVTSYIESTTGESVTNYHGIAVEEAIPEGGFESLDTDGIPDAVGNFADSDGIIQDYGDTADPFSTYHGINDALGGNEDDIGGGWTSNFDNNFAASDGGGAYDDTAAAGMDCSCLADVLGNLLENLGDNDS